MQAAVRRPLIPLAALLFALAAASPALARPELTYLSGRLHSPDETGITFTTQWEYLQEVSGPFAFSVSYLNEGHLEDPVKHHRDGFALGLWARRPVLAPWLFLGAGAGPYFWYDTRRPPGDSDDYARGMGLLASVAAKVRLPWGGLYLQGRINWVEIRDNVDTRAALVGVGTDFSSADVLDRSLARVARPDAKNVILIHIHALSKNGTTGIEYRLSPGFLGGLFEVGASYLVTNDTPSGSFRPYGAEIELWAVNTDVPRLKLGFGGGLFLDLLDSPYEPSGIFSCLASLRLGGPWVLQFRRCRIVPNEDHDEDIRTIAIGYAF